MIWQNELFSFLPYSLRTAVDCSQVCLSCNGVSCKICGHQSSTSEAYVRHLKIHSNVPNLALQCCIPNCKGTFRKRAGPKVHLYRNHKKCVNEPRLCTLVDLTRHVDFCSVKCDSLTEFYSHLKMDIKEGWAVACLFEECDKTLTVLSTMTSHLSRKHKVQREILKSSSLAQQVQVELVAPIIIVTWVTCSLMLLMIVSIWR